MMIGTSERVTRETEVKVSLKINGKGTHKISTSIGFLDHMLIELAVHSLMDLEILAKGDLEHHIVEDVAITLGETLEKALGERKGIRRFGDAIVPMDDAMALAAVDLVHRSYSSVELSLRGKKIEDITSEDLVHFIQTLSGSLQATIHVQVMKGKNDHHKIEAAFKALALALREAWSSDIGREGVPSSKGKI